MATEQTATDATATDAADASASELTARVSAPRPPDGPVVSEVDGWLAAADGGWLLRSAGASVELTELLAAFTDAASRNIGFPAATDIDYTVLAPFLRFVLNNVGDPDVPGAYPLHTKHLEQDVIADLAALFRAPGADIWGYIATGATEGGEYALWQARKRWPDLMVYHSTKVHHSYLGILDRLQLESVPIAVDDHDVIDYTDLRRQVEVRRHRPALVIANAGTGMCEGVDNVAEISDVLYTLAVRRRSVHVDAAMSGIPLGLTDPRSRPGFDFLNGADSIVVSGHKFLGIPIPCAAVLIRDSLREDSRRPATYTGSPDVTVANSRSGFAVLCWWYAMRSLGWDGLRARVEASRELAEYAYHRLSETGWPVDAHGSGFTVVLTDPPAAVARRWPLASDGADSHVITMPGVTREQIDAFAEELIAGAVPPDAVELGHTADPADVGGSTDTIGTEGVGVAERLTGSTVDTGTRLGRRRWRLVKGGRR